MGEVCGLRVSDVDFMRDTLTPAEAIPEGLRFHDLRHHYASVLIAAGLDVKTVQARMRHASLRTTLDTYGHLMADADDRSRGAVETAWARRSAPLSRRISD